MEIAAARKAALAPENARRADIFRRSRPAGVEIPLALGTGLLADVPAGLAGLASLPFVGAEGAANNVQAVQNALTYQPTGDATYSLLDDAAPTLNKIDRAMSAPADWVADKTGSPALAAAAYTAPDALAEVAGLGLLTRPVRRAVAAAPRVAANVARGAKPALVGAAAGGTAGYLLDDEAGAAVGALAGAGMGEFNRQALRAGRALPNVPKSQQGIFAGFGGGANEPKDALALAEQMAHDGNMSTQLLPGSAEWHELNRRIWAETGAKFGPASATAFSLDMLPMYEIDDSGSFLLGEAQDRYKQAKFVQELAKRTDPAAYPAASRAAAAASAYVPDKNGFGGLAGPGPSPGLPNIASAEQRIVHPELFNRFPGLRTLQTEWDPPSPGVEYQGEMDSTGVTNTRMPHKPVLRLSAALRDKRTGTASENPRKVMLHELQHAVQSKTGLGNGGSPRHFPNAANPMAEYARIHAETMARATEKRRDYSSAERAAVYPYDDFMLPDPATSGGQPTVNFGRQRPVPQDGTRWWNPSPTQPAKAPRFYGIL
ncbi:hypothetical protein [Flavobacterium sp.]|jgi:hypothetical protein|uniref:hypothetical protein n=1 Tax=Flavobacterium sp. TaxID=239 RepID=UPI0037C0C660